MKSLMKWVALFGLPAIILTLFGVPAAHALTIANAHSLSFGLMGTTVGASVVTLLDWAKRADPGGGIAKIAELLSQKNEILEDMVWKEGNLPVGDRISMRTGLPTPFWRSYNLGVPKTKSTTAQVDEQCGMLEDRSEVDKDLAELEDDLAAFRLSEASAHIEGMSQGFAKALIYGNAGVNPQQFSGLALRYGTISGAGNAQNIISAGGATSTCTSIYLVGWSPNTIYGIFPKGSKAGLLHQDLGEGDAFDGSNNRFRAYMDRFQWKGGLAVKDWRYGVRICNIDVPTLILDPTAATIALVNLMAKSIDRLPGLAGVKPVFYANRTVKSMLRIQALSKSVAQLGVEKAINQFGQTIHEVTFLGIPVRTVDQILETEAQVS